MGDLRDYLATRRSVSAAFLSDPGPDPATLADILTLAARVPDHGKLAPWRFIVFSGEGRERAGEVLAAAAQAGGMDRNLDDERRRFARAPLVVAVVSRAAPHVKIPEWEQVLSAGAVCVNLIHAAAAHGFGAQWVTEWPAYDAAARAGLGIGEDEKVAGFIHIGVPTAPVTDRTRPDLAQIVTHF